MITEPNTAADDVAPAGIHAFGLSALMVAAASLVGLVMAPRWGAGAVDLLYLPAVLGAAIVGGFWPALFAALASALAYNFFFTAPQHSFRIESPEDIVTVVVLFAVAVITSRLAASVREQARIASGHAARNATIAGLSGRLLACTSEREIAEVAVAQIGPLFESNAVLLQGLSKPELVAASPPATLTPSDLAAAAMALETGKPAGRGVVRVEAAQWQFHPINSGEKCVAAFGLARDDGAPPATAAQQVLLDNLLDQVALALERARLENVARTFATVRERDRLRSALLSTVGRDVRPSLTAIIDAVGQLRREGASDRAIVSNIGAEAMRLDRYVSNLLDLGSEVDDQPVQAGEVTIDLSRRSVWKGDENVRLTPKEFAVLAELAKYPGRVLSHAHLLRSVWGPAQETHTDYLRVAVRALRQKLEADPKQPSIIINEPAVGYRLVVEGS